MEEAGTKGLYGWISIKGVSTVGFEETRVSVGASVVGGGAAEWRQLC